MLADPELTSPTPDLLQGAALFLDFDGTLVDLADRPEAVVIDPALGPLLVRLAHRLDGAVAIITGRSVAQVDTFLGESLAAYAVAGSHGAEIRKAGADIVSPERPTALQAAEALFHDRFGAEEGVVIEVKSLGVALHYRLAPAIEAEAQALVEQFAQREGLAVQHGKMMAELRMPGHDKGTAIVALAEAAPFAGRRPVFVGDDLTDESGFAACAALGGAGVLIGPARKTAARHRLPDVSALRDWLEGVAA